MTGQMSSLSDWAEVRVICVCVCEAREGFERRLVNTEKPLLGY